MKKIVCPGCHKEIDKQADIEIPASTTPVDYEKISVLIPPTDLTGVTHGSLFFKDGEYYLIFETVCKCPYCQTLFELDVPLRVEDLLAKV